MITPEGLKKLKEDLGEESEQKTRFYLEKIIDFAKWTTTVTLAAFLWIGTHFDSFGNRLSLIISLLFFGATIIIPFLYVMRILEWMKSKAELTSDHLESVNNYVINSPVNDETGSKNKISTRRGEEHGNLFNLLKKLNTDIAIHGLCLVGGIVFFLLAMFI